MSHFLGRPEWVLSQPNTLVFPTEHEQNRLPDMVNPPGVMMFDGHMANLWFPPCCGCTWCANLMHLHDACRIGSTFWLAHIEQTTKKRTPVYCSFYCLEFCSKERNVSKGIWVHLGSIGVNSAFSLLVFICSRLLEVRCVHSVGRCPAQRRTGWQMPGPARGADLRQLGFDSRRLGVDLSFEVIKSPWNWNIYRSVGVA